MMLFQRLPLSFVVMAGMGVGVVGGFEFPDCVSGPLASNTVCDLKAAPADRAAALVRAMDISEKLVNLVDMSLGAKRIGLPPYAWWNEALHGVAASPGVSFNWTGSAFSHATSFPNTISMAAGFDDDMIYKIGDIISTEARAFINAGRAGLEYWTPNVNPYKDPRWGRGHETPGEDPVLIKGFTKSMLAGLEGTGSIRKIIATCKHYAAYDLERWKGAVRHRFNAVVSSQDLSEYYLPPFQQCARDSKVGSFMCAYNALNGTPACASTYLMDDILRKHWNWTEHNNFITSDCNAVQDFLPIQHNFSQTPAEAAAAALKAGADTICEVPQWPPLSDIVGAYNQTLLSEAIIDRALKRLYEGLIRAGYFDPASASPYRSIGWSDVNTPQARNLAYQSAVDGLVLLKNDGTLPLKLQRKSLALIGFWANGGAQMLGGYSGFPPYLHSPVYAAHQLNITYYTQPGPPAKAEASLNSSWIAPTLSATDKADVVIYFGGTDTTIAAEDTDRESIAWPSAQLSLINRLATLGKPLIVVHLGDQVDDTPLLTNPNISAIIWAGYPGQSGGTAVLDVIRGKAAPAGWLPVTQYPAKYVDQIPMTEMTLRPKANQPGRTYRWYSDAVLPFGYGLHHTTFNTTLSPPIPPSSPSLLSNCTSTHPDLCSFATVPFTVTNTGFVKSDYVALLFVSGEFGPKPYPIKTLVGYKRMRNIEPGKTAMGEIELSLGSIARTDESGNLVLYPGKYKLVSDVDGRSEVVFELQGEERVLDWFPQPGGGVSAEGRGVTGMGDLKMVGAVVKK